MVSPLEAAALLVLFTFLPPLLFALGLRNAERRAAREPWARVLVAFLYGAVVAILIAGVGEAYLLRTYYSGSTTVRIGALVLPALAVLIAPVIEECAKALGLFVFRDAHPEPENGYVYGGAVGLGFAATENLLYVGLAYVTSGQDVALVLGIYRGVATVALHAAATAIVGYGVWRLRFGHRRVLGFLLFPFSLGTAILIHAVYNAIASAEAGALVAVAFALVVFSFVYRRIRSMDARP